MWGSLFARLAMATGWRFNVIRWLTMFDVAGFRAVWAESQVTVGPSHRTSLPAGGVGGLVTSGFNSLKENRHGAAKQR